MKNYKFVCEAWDTGYGIHSITEPLAGIDFKQLNFSEPDINVITGIGAAAGVGVAAIFTKYFREVKRAIIASETAEEAYQKFQDIVYNDRLIFTRRSLLKTPVIDRYFEKLVQRNDPAWKQKILKRLNWCKNIIYVGAGIGGGLYTNISATRAKHM